MAEKTQFEIFLETNVNEYTEKKNGLTYLSWTYAWKEFKKVYPGAYYQIHHWDGKPYIYDENLGYMVETTVYSGEADGVGETLSMWLPVMNGANKAMKDKPYTYEVKDYKTNNIVQKTVEAATMFDINTSIMRCLVKNIAMFGLGLYIYAGEDLPDTPFEAMTTVQYDMLDRLGVDWAKLYDHLNVKGAGEISKETAEALIKAKKLQLEKQQEKKDA